MRQRCLRVYYNCYVDLREILNQIKNSDPACVFQPASNGETRHFA